jgi:hypothetical protein
MLLYGMAVSYLMVNSISLRLVNQYMFASLRVNAMSTIPGVFFFKLKARLRYAHVSIGNYFPSFRRSFVPLFTVLRGL